MYTLPTKPPCSTCSFAPLKSTSGSVKHHILWYMLYRCLYFYCIYPEACHFQTPMGIGNYSLIWDSSSNSHPIKKSPTDIISLSSLTANINTKNSFSFSVLTLSSLGCSFHASLIHWPCSLPGSPPADDVFQKDLLLVFILLASCC